jgi:hypothetical protein
VENVRGVYFIVVGQVFVACFEVLKVRQKGYEWYVKGLEEAYFEKDLVGHLAEYILGRVLVKAEYGKIPVLEIVPFGVVVVVFVELLERMRIGFERMPFESV